MSEVYTQPGALAQDDGDLYETTDDGASAKLGPGTDGTQIPADGSTSAIMWFTTKTDSVTVAKLDGQAADQVTVDGDESATTALVHGADAYLQDGDEVDAFEFGANKPDSQDDAVARYKLPALPDDSTVMSSGVRPVGGPGLVTGIAWAQNGDVYALSTNGQAADVADLTTGKDTAIPGFGYARGLALTPSGDLLTTAWTNDPSASVGTIHALEISPEGFAVQEDLDLKQPGSNLRHVDILEGLAHDGVIAISSGDSESTITFNMWTIDGSAAEPVPGLNSVAGLDASVAGQDSVYIFGGPAENQVSTVDLSNGTVTTSNKVLTAPSGTYILGISSQTQVHSS